MTNRTTPLVTLVAFALLGASVVFWGLRLAGRTDASPAVLVPAATSVPELDSAAVARALGAPVAAATSQGGAGHAARFVLRGVVATGHHGAALIAVDGQAAKPYVVGSDVAPGYKLKAVGARHADLGEGAGAVRLDLPATPR